MQATGPGASRDDSRLLVAAGVAAVQADLDAGRLGRAQRRMDELLATWPGNPKVQDQLAAVLEARGEISEAVRALTRLNARRPDPDRLAREARLGALLLATDPRWMPRVPGPPRTGEAAPDVVAHLAGRGSGSAVEASALLEAGITVVPVDLERLPFGSAYPAGRPLPERLEDEAWLAARAVQAVHPSVLHATADERGDAVALVGLALRAHLGSPLVVELPRTPGPVETGELGGRRAAAHARVLREADAIVIPAPEARERAVAAGADPAGVVVIPPGSDDASAALASLYRAVAPHGPAGVRRREAEDPA